MFNFLKHKPKTYTIINAGFKINRDNSGSTCIGLVLSMKDDKGVVIESVEYAECPYFENYEIGEVHYLDLIIDNTLSIFSAKNISDLIGKTILIKKENELLPEISKDNYIRFIKEKYKSIVEEKKAIEEMFYSLGIHQQNQYTTQNQHRISNPSTHSKFK